MTEVVEDLYDELMDHGAYLAAGQVYGVLHRNLYDSATPSDEYVNYIDSVSGNLDGLEPGEAPPGSTYNTNLNGQNSDSSGDEQIQEDFNEASIEISYTEPEYLQELDEDLNEYMESSSEEDQTVTEDWEAGQEAIIDYFRDKQDLIEEYEED